MSSTDLPQRPVPPENPLERHRVIPSGPHIGRILLVVGAAIGLGLALHMMTRGDDPGVPTIVSRFEAPAPEARLPSYADLATPQVPAATPPMRRFEMPQDAIPRSVEPTLPPPRRDELWDRALEAGVGGWSRRDDGRAIDAGGARATGTDGGPMQTAEKFAPVASECFVPPGTPIEAQTITRIVTERPGIVTAMVTRDVWSAGFDCLAVPAGSTLTMAYGTETTRGQKRIDIADPTIVRPWPRSDIVQVAAMTADGTGASGLPGRFDVPWLRTGVLIASSAAVDLGTAVLTGGGSLIGGILGRTMDSPLDRAARDLLERSPVVTLEAGAPILVILRGGLLADEFRDG